MLKEFPHSSKIELESRGIFEAAYRNLPPSVSDLVFTNLFSWQDIYPYRISAVDRFLLIHYREDDKYIFLPPLLLDGKINAADFGPAFASAAQCIGDFCSKHGLGAEFRFVPELYLKYMKKDAYAPAQERDYSDYMYKRDNLARLPGQKYSAKRNLIKQFQRKYSGAYEPLSENNLHLVYKLLETDGSKTDYKVIERMVKNFVPLGLTGGLLISSGQVIAGTIGTVVGNFLYKKGCYNAAVVHFEKARLDHKGAYQAINNYFSSTLGENIDYVNREEDLGLEGLRKAKMSYHPDRLIEKYRFIISN
ncbi:MAG: phosphatidylglycerol lysyltransferase domain-containing protein [Elusimicrobiota bacterium]